MGEEMSCWRDKYDMVISIRSVVCRDRVPSLERELARVGIEPDIRLWSVPSPFEFNAGERPGVRPVRSMADRSRPGFLNSGLAHYRAWKTALGLGAQRALILEDDVRFLRDLDALRAVVGQTPDRDICLYDLLKSGNEDASAVRATLDARRLPESPLWAEPTERPCSFACYGATRAALAHLAGCVDGAYMGRWRLHIVDHYMHRQWLGDPPRIAIACAWPLACIQRPFRTSPNNTTTVFNHGKLDAQLDWYANGLGLDLDAYED